MFFRRIHLQTQQETAAKEASEINDKLKNHQPQIEGNLCKPEDVDVSLANEVTQITNQAVHPPFKSDAYKYGHSDPRYKSALQEQLVFIK